MLALHSAGLVLLEPFGENTRYDLIVDDGTTLTKLQCKSGRLRSGTIQFATCSCYGHHRNPGHARLSYRGQVDAFGVFCRETSGVYLVPIAICGDVQMSLRVAPCRNNQRAGVHWARDYQVATVRVDVATRALSVIF